jgi:hypothetical protein
MPMWISAWLSQAGLPDDIRQKGMPVATTIRIFWRLIKWKLTAGNKSYPFFDASGKNISKPIAVNPGSG